MAINSFPPAGGAGGYEFPSELIDPVSKFRVSQPENLIDTDFEYGLQPTKWETVELINNTPSFFSKSGDTTIDGISSIITNAGTREIIVKTELDHGLAVGIPINVTGTKSITADGSYIINSIPDTKTFTYLCKDDQDDTASILDLYSSIITGEFFQGSQLRVSDSEGIVTDAAGTSELTVTTNSTHGFGENTPFYFLNLNSTVAQEFQGANTASKTFDASNSATAQTFDGSNTLSSFNIDWSNSAVEGGTVSNITSTDTANSRITVSHTNENFANLPLGTPLYYSVSATSGYFNTNPRGVVFLKTTTSLGTSNSTFQVSLVPDGEPLLFTTNLSGTFQVANQARTFAGNNINPLTQVSVDIEVGQEFFFDGGNRGYATVIEGGTPPTGISTVVSYSGTSITISSLDSELDYYNGAMLKYSSSTNQPATNLLNNATYFVKTFVAGGTAGQYVMTLSEFPGIDAPAITVSGGGGIQTFLKIGVSVDKDIVHIRNSDFSELDMLEYSFPTSGRFSTDDNEDQKLYYFVDNAYDSHNYTLNSEPGFRPIQATGGNIVETRAFNNKLYRVHTFTSSGTFSVANTGDTGQVEVLLVGGGGGGGTSLSGGGGGGAVITATLDPGQASYTGIGNYNIVVGNGGVGGGGDQSTNDGGKRGVASTAFGISATGGGGAPNRFASTYQNSTDATQGANGGGGSPDGPQAGRPGVAPTLPTGVTGTVYAGRTGGNGVGGDPNYPGGGGAGAGQNGFAPANSSAKAGAGGDGVQINFNGTNLWFAGGGGGSAYVSGNGAGNGGRGGGGGGVASTGVSGVGDASGLNPGGTPPNNTGSSGSTKGGNGGLNTGGGGGGGQHPEGDGGDGGRGIVIIRYPLIEELAVSPSAIQATGGVETLTIQESQGNNETLFQVYKTHTFTSAGSSSFIINSLATGIDDGNVLEVLLVGGGGAGASSLAGGGGGGAVIVASIPLNQAGFNGTGTYNIVVGAGGVPGAGGQSVNDGGRRGAASTAFGISATGGGGAHNRFATTYQNSVDATQGANGGGGSADGFQAGRPGVAPTLPAGVTGTVYAGRTGGNGGGADPNYPGGGGAGAGQNGFTPAGASAKAGAGGDGVQINFNGTNLWFAGGGGGSSYMGTAGAGNGGRGGGGGGVASNGTSGTGDASGLNPGGTPPNNAGATGTTRGGNGGVNTGGGGGAGQHDAALGGDGGRGIVMIKYRVSKQQGARI
jgi:hypothetical protein